MSKDTGYVRHFVACNAHDLSHFLPLWINDKRYGYVEKNLAAFLRGKSGAAYTHPNGLILEPRRCGDFAARSKALLHMTEVAAQYFKKPLRGELYAVVENWEDEPIAQVDRAAIPWLGLRAWGVHVNGYVRKADGIHLWVGQRAKDRPAEPGKLDNMVGGGQPIGLTVEENLCKEAQEEAGIEAALAKTAKLVRTLDYRVARKDGLRTDTLFIYDLELPESFTPQNTDGEVAAFHLMPLPKVADLVRETDKFKFNCNLVVIDFMMRHGFITAADPEFEELTKWLKA